MSRFFLYLLAVLSALLTLGLSGWLAVGYQYSIDFIIIALWLYCWLTNLEMALLFALAAGVLLDFVSFLPFGIWTGVFVALALVVSWLRERYLTVSSFWQALAALAAATLLYHLAIGIVIQAFYPSQVLVSLLLNVTVGALIYYLLVTRFRMLQRWHGQQLS
ncbi:MAG: hypothetical protein WEC83_00725 [Patescibacteria group bacterium]